MYILLLLVDIFCWLIYVIQYHFLVSYSSFRRISNRGFSQKTKFGFQIKCQIQKISQIGAQFPPCARPYFLNTMAGNIAQVQQQFYKNNRSFVICGLQKDVVQLLEQKELLEFMNVTPSESEAWDILQMEEIERELLRGEWN